MSKLEIILSDRKYNRYKASSRIVNGKESTKDYLWLVFITKWNKALLNNKKFSSSNCCGAIISKNM